MRELLLYYIERTDTPYSTLAKQVGCSRDSIKNWAVGRGSITDIQIFKAYSEISTCKYSEFLKLKVYIKKFTELEF